MLLYSLLWGVKATCDSQQTMPFSQAFCRRPRFLWPAHLVLSAQTPRSHLPDGSSLLRRHANSAMCRDLLLRCTQITPCTARRTVHVFPRARHLARDGRRRVERLPRPRRVNSLCPLLSDATSYAPLAPLASGPILLQGVEPLRTSASLLHRQVRAIIRSRPMCVTPALPRQNPSRGPDCFKEQDNQRLPLVLKWGDECAPCSVPCLKTLVLWRQALPLSKCVMARAGK